MKVTIRVEITTDCDETETFEIGQLERPYRQLEPDKVGLSLAEGKDLLRTNGNGKGSPTCADLPR